MIRTLLLVVAMLLAPLHAANAHAIYTSIYGKNGQLCCGGTDCAETIYREVGSTFEFLTREKEWIAIPSERITFLAIPGDDSTNSKDLAHLCYRPATDNDRLGIGSSSVFGSIFLYCAFIPPGGV